MGWERCSRMRLGISSVIFIQSFSLAIFHCSLFHPPVFQFSSFAIFHYSLLHPPVFQTSSLAIFHYSLFHPPPVFQSSRLSIFHYSLPHSPVLQSSSLSILHYSLSHPPISQSSSLPVFLYSISIRSDSIPFAPPHFSPISCRRTRAHPVSRHHIYAAAAIHDTSAWYVLTRHYRQPLSSLHCSCLDQ